MKNALRIFALVVLGLGLAVGQWHIIEARFGDGLAPLAEAANGVLTGHPHWANYQNRVAGPLLYSAIRSAIHRNDAAAFQITFVLLLWLFFCIHGAGAWRMTRSINRTALAMLAAFALSAVLMQPPWLYLWDAIDLSIFSLLAWALLTRGPLWVIVAAITVEIFNREMALVLSVAVLAEGVIEWRQTRKATQNGDRLVLCLGGFVIITLIRRTMLVATLLPPQYQSSSPAAGAGPLFWQNFCNLGIFIGKGQNFIRDLPPWLVIFAIAAQLLRAGAGVEHRRAALWFGVIFLAVWAFGYAMEWRVWLDFIPYLALAACLDPPGTPTTNRVVPV